MRKLLRLFHLIKLLVKWVPLILAIINTEDDKDDPESPVTESDFKSKALDIVTANIGIGTATDLVSSYSKLFREDNESDEELFQKTVKNLLTKQITWLS